ncbi:F-box domain protein [Ancylostoma ceylanicum]|uniref:F-box domain protein n=1 Tax=Ancylostoma ceylanicum TaxID=53326 RepID=A0A0D6LF74_9BILA|nr:F-box domain protein [Ancylostoma ceylanicum]
MVKTRTLLFQEFPNDVLARIFRFLDCKTLLNCELTCKRWSNVIEEHLEALPKLSTDQIRILFDEAEVFIYPIDEKRCPVRYAMPSLQLEKLLRANRDTVVDIGLEECSPPHLFTDQLLDALLPGLTCVRLWNNGKSGNYGISDRSINKLAR